MEKCCNQRICSGPLRLYLSPAVPERGGGQQVLPPDPGGSPGLLSQRGLSQVSLPSLQVFLPFPHRSAFLLSRSSFFSSQASLSSLQVFFPFPHRSAFLLLEGQSSFSAGLPSFLLTGQLSFSSGLPSFSSQVSLSSLLSTGLPLFFP